MRVYPVLGQIECRGLLHSTSLVRASDARNIHMEMGKFLESSDDHPRENPRIRRVGGSGQDI